MNNLPCAIPLVTFDVNEAKFEKENFKKIVERNEVEGLPAVVISIAGAYRSGKSFLLNFFLKYLNASDKSNWLDDNQLSGFDWKEGSKGVTKGIVIWSEIFKVQTSSRDEVAVILMDTQGVFEESSLQQDAIVFGLSTLMSSLQIYNISNQIDESHLHNLIQFVEFSKIAGTVEGQGTFQSLKFLIRDWCNQKEFSFGKDGGNSYLSEKLTLTQNLNRDSKTVREELRSAFSDTSCFLLPHPGMNVASTAVSDLAEIFSLFIEHVRALIPSVLGPENLVVKEVNGSVCTCAALIELCDRYTDAYNSGETPEPMTLLVASIKSTCFSRIAELFSEYKISMKEETTKKENKPLISSENLQSAHEANKNSVCVKYDESVRSYQNDITAEFRKKLVDQIDEYFEGLKALNWKNEKYIEEISLSLAEKSDDCFFRYQADMEKQINSIKPFVDSDELRTLHRQISSDVLRKFDVAKNRLDSNAFVGLAHELSEKIQTAFTAYDEANRNNKARHEELELKKQQFSSECKTQKDQSISLYKTTMQTMMDSVENKPFLESSKLLETHKYVKDFVLAKFDQEVGTDLKEISSKERIKLRDKIDEMFQNCIDSNDKKHKEFKRNLAEVDQAIKRCLDKFIERMEREMIRVERKDSYLSVEAFKKRFDKETENLLKDFDKETSCIDKDCTAQKRQTLRKELERQYERFYQRNLDNRAEYDIKQNLLISNISIALGTIVIGAGCAAGGVVVAPFVALEAVGAAAIGSALGSAAGAGLGAGVGSKVNQLRNPENAKQTAEFFNQAKTAIEKSFAGYYAGGPAGAVAAALTAFNDSDSSLQGSQEDECRHNKKGSDAYYS